MTFGGQLRKTRAALPKMTDAELTAAYNDLNRAAKALYFGASDRILNLCNEVVDAAATEIKSRKDRHNG